MNSDSNPNQDPNAAHQPAGVPHPAKPGMPPVKVTWKTTISEAKAHAAKLDADIAAMTQQNAAASDSAGSSAHGVQSPSPQAHKTSPTSVQGASNSQAAQLAQLAARWRLAQQEYGEYHPMAYQFVRECVRHTVEMVHGLREMEERESTALAAPDPTRHVSAQQLCYGLKDLSTDRYGGMARTVLSHWGIRSTRDVGNIVFAMLAVGILGRSENDSLEQFENVFDFGEEFAFSG